MPTIIVVAIVGGWHTFSLARRGQVSEAWAVGCLWAVTAALTWAVVTNRSPELLDAVLRALFGGLSAWFKGT
ncbi:MAG: hypothetical protein A2Y96_01575 [Firmicutes bacterium RBG_13_65_8]|nr:MAG: hypothetical protein A2Y96_01575 [Firmicutes bacterium RBG_13_65_8]